MSPARKKPDPSSSGNKTTKRRASPAPQADAMTEDVMEFIAAIDDYKRANQRPFPTWSEILEILKTLGYQRKL